MKNLEWNIYTYKHRKAFRFCAEKLIKEPTLREHMLKRAKIHDMDKMILYLFFDQPTAQKMHVQNRPHHLENAIPKSYEDLVEAVIDYECAPYTKPDKPWNAYDFVHVLADMKLLDEEMQAKLFGIMKDLGIDRPSAMTIDPEGIAYIESLGEISEEMIYEEILCYVNEHPDNALNWVLEMKHKNGTE